jgi:hypothetical protein
MAPNDLWQAKYAPRFAQLRAEEEARREQAFLSLPITVCGEELRPMTAQDLLVLNGINSPFVCPTEVGAVELAMFLWILNVKNDGTQGWWNMRRRHKMFQRIGPMNFEEAVQECNAYVEGVFQDAPKGSGGSGGSEGRRPLGTCFLVPLVMRIAKETGWERDVILNTPLAQLFQYLKYIQAQAQGKDFNDWSPSDTITNEFLCELNASR